MKKIIKLIHLTSNELLQFNFENAWETTLSFNPDAIAGKKKQINAWTRRVVPIGIL